MESGERRDEKAFPEALDVVRQGADERVSGPMSEDLERS